MCLFIFKSCNCRDLKIAPKRSLWSVCPHPLTGSRGFWLFNPIIWGHVWHLLRDCLLFIAGEDQTSGRIQSAAVCFSFPASIWIIARQYFSVSLLSRIQASSFLPPMLALREPASVEKHSRLATDSFTHANSFSPFYLKRMGLWIKQHI